MDNQCVHDACLPNRYNIMCNGTLALDVDMKGKQLKGIRKYQKVNRKEYCTDVTLMPVGECDTGPGNDVIQ